MSLVLPITQLLTIMAYAVAMVFWRQTVRNLMRSMRALQERQDALQTWCAELWQLYRQRWAANAQGWAGGLVSPAHPPEYPDEASARPASERVLELHAEAAAWLREAGLPGDQVDAAAWPTACGALLGEVDRLRRQLVQSTPP